MQTESGYWGSPDFGVYAPAAIAACGCCDRCVQVLCVTRESTVSEAHRLHVRPTAAAHWADDIMKSAAMDQERASEAGV
jgi:hypothetical protein